MRLTVVIPTINRKTLNSAILSALNIKMTENIIVVSHSELSGSQPSCGIPIQNIVIKDTDACSKRNAGFEAVRSEYVLFLDDDDQICNFDIEKYVDVLADPNCAGLIFDVRIKTLSKSKVVRKKQGKIFARDLLLRNVVGTTSSVLLKTCQLEENDIRFDKRNICRQDFDMWIQILNRKGRYFFSTGVIGLEYLETDDPTRISKQKTSKKLISLIFLYIRHLKLSKLYIFTIFNHARYLLSQVLK